MTKINTVSFVKLLEKIIKTDVKFVDGALENARKKIQKKKTPNDKFVAKILEKELNKSKGAQFDKIEFEIDKDNKSVDDRQVKVHIIWGMGSNNGIVTMYYSPGLYEVFDKNFKYWKIFKQVVAEILSHEFVHIIQFDKIIDKYKHNPLGYLLVINGLEQDEQQSHLEYLSQKMEIMSFARQAVQEFKGNGFTNEEIIEYIKNFSKADFDDSYIFYVYVYFFKKDDKVLKKFLKNVYDYVK